jgi:hypothetical protein
MLGSCHADATSGYAPAVARLTVEEIRVAIDQLTRDRQALDGSYADLKKDLGKMATKVRSGQSTKPDPEVVQLLLRLANHVEMERAQVETLWQLLHDAYASAVDLAAD